MKAESAVFKNIQNPMTIFGISLKLLTLVFAMGMVFFIIFLVINLMQIALLFLIIFIFISWMIIFRKTQKNPHFANYILKSRQFWQGRSYVILNPGDPSLKAKGGNN